MQEFYEIQQYAQQLNQQFAEYFKYWIIASMILALVYVFFGYRLMRFIIAFWGAAAGALIAYGVSEYAGLDKLFLRVTVILLAALLIGQLAYALYKIILFLGITGAGAIIGYLLYEQSAAGLIAGLAVGLVLAILAMIFIRPIIIVLTALKGAYEAGNAIALLADSQQAGIAAFAVLLIAGCAFQFFNTRKKRAKAEQPDTSPEFGPVSYPAPMQMQAVPAMAQSESAQTAQLPMQPARPAYEEPAVAAPAMPADFAGFMAGASGGLQNGYRALLAGNTADAQLAVQAALAADPGDVYAHFINYMVQTGICSEENLSRAGRPMANPNFALAMQYAQGVQRQWLERLCQTIEDLIAQEP